MLVQLPDEQTQEIQQMIATLLKNEIHHFKEDIDLDKLSELTFLNKYYLVHAFNQYKGISPMRYLIQRRISEAKFLLETTSYSMNDISAIIGFSNQNYFTFAFKREIGCSPSTYRKQFLKAKN